MEVKIPSKWKRSMYYHWAWDWIDHDFKFVALDLCSRQYHYASSMFSDLANVSGSTFRKVQCKKPILYLKWRIQKMATRRSTNTKSLRPLSSKTLAALFLTHLSFPGLKVDHGPFCVESTTDLMLLYLHDHHVLGIKFDVDEPESTI